MVEEGQPVVVCPKCQTPSPRDAPFCVRCGYRLVVYCPNCQTSSPGDAVFCAKCGYRLAELNSEIDEKFLNDYTFAPGCGFYFFSRPLWPFILLNLFFGLLSEFFKSVATSTDIEGHAAVSVLLWLLALAVTIAWFCTLLLLGTVTRRRRWVGLRWRSFAQFKG